MLRQAYERTAAELPPGADPEEYVMILPDRGDRITRAFGLRDTGRVAAVAVVYGGGRVAGVHQGERPDEMALGLLEARDNP